MEILFLSLIDFDSLYERGIYTDLLREFAANNHKIYAISPVEKRSNRRTNIIEVDACKILKLEIGNIQKTNFIEKGISTIMLEPKLICGIRKYFNDTKFDLILYATPPITFAKVVEFVKKRDDAKSYLLLKDIWPQGVVDMGAMATTGPMALLYKYFRAKEKKLYLNSDYIGCMSPANMDYILKHNPEIPRHTVEVCPNAIEPLNIKKDKELMQKVRLKYNIPLDKTVFIYGGNLGKPQGIDFLIECLEANKHNQQVYFIIAGSGTELNKLKKYFDHNKPDNAQLFGQMPKLDYEALANSCDVGLIFLDKRFTIPNFPSRLLSYMQASMPVLAATDVNTDLGQVIEKGQFGFWCESGNLGEFNEKVKSLCNQDLRREMGLNARQYLEDNYTARHSYDIIMKHFGDGQEAGD